MKKCLTVLILNLLLFYLPADAQIAQIPVEYTCDEICKCKRTGNLNVNNILENIRLNTIEDKAFLACVYHQIAVKYYAQMEYALSYKYNDMALQIRSEINDSQLWKSQLNLGISCYWLKKFKDSKELLKKAYITYGYKRKRDSLNIFRHLAMVNLKLGETEKSIDYINKLFTIKTDPLNTVNNYILLATNIIEIGDSSRIHEAIQFANKALEIDTTNEDINLADLAYNQLSHAYSFLGDHNKSIQYLYKALKHSKNDNVYKKAIYYTGLSNEFFLIQEYQKALNKSKESLILKREFYKTKWEYAYAVNYENSADNYVALEKFEDALNFYQKALMNLTNNFRDENIYNNPNLNDLNLFIYSDQYLIQVLHLKATAAYQYYQQNDSIKYLNLANQTYQTAFDFHDELQKDISTENSRLFQVKNIVPYIENALKVAYELQQSGQDVGEAAFRFMEKNKATVLLQSMNEAEALQFANLPDSLLEQEKDLKIAIAFYNKQLNDAIEYEDTIEIDRLNNVLFQEKETYRQLITDLENNYPNYHRLKYQQNQTHLKDVQQSLDNQTALIEYFVGDSSIYILSIQKDNSQLYQFQKPTDWEEVVQQFLSTFNVDSIYTCYTDEYDPFLFNDFTLFATQLYDSLLAKPLKDLDNQITQLQIIPDATLNYVPFELLLTNKHFPKKDDDYRNLPYLIKEKTISYAYSTALLLEGKDDVDRKYKYQYAGFAPSYANNDQYFSLPATPGNVNKIAKQFNGIPFVDLEATDPVFKDTIQQYQMFQFAGHGDIDDKNPLNSKLVFTKINDNTDHELHAYELYNLEIPAELGVLSACETGLGKTAKGEGIMSLSRAFTYAGCNSLVMSLWSIYDKQTAEIVDNFFTHLKKGKTKNEALRQAKLDYLENADNTKTHPIYWAGLVQSGNTTPIDFGGYCPCWWVIIFSILVIVSTLFFFKKRGNS